MTTSDRSWGWHFGLASWLAMGGAIATSGDCVLAQIAPDTTLGASGSVVTPTNIDGLPTERIDGGAKRGANLFHSFEQFSVPTGSAAYFNNAADIQNIISRVTGESISNIDGLIRANGTANVFLLNPNGIIFGSNARLDIGGSFLASTASSLNFADGTQFSATAPQTTPLLTVSVPLGLQFGSNAGSIQVQGNGQGLRATSDLIDTTVGLRVQPDETLAMVGGSVALEGGTLKTAGGRIELGSVAGSGLVNLTSIDSGWALGYTGVPNFGDIQLSGAAAVDASGEGSGDIQVWGRRVTLTDGSQIEASTLGLEPGGKLNVTAKELVELIGRSADGNFRSGLFTDVYEGATGSGSNLTIETGKLIVRDGARVSTTTWGSGQGGNLTVTASEAVELSGRSAGPIRGVFVDPFSPTPDTSGLFTRTLGAGSAGNLTIATEKLTVQNGASVASDTRGQGRGGNLTVNAPDSVEVIGLSFLTTETRGAGAAGDLTIETGKLFVRNVASVSTETWDEGPGGRLEVSAAESVELTDIGRLSTSSLLDGAAGDLTITTGKLLVQNASAVTASTLGLGAGRGGDLTVTARESVELSNNKPRFANSVSGLTTSTGGIVDAGDITISTGKLTIQDGASVRAETLGAGRGGNITVTAQESVELIGTSADGQNPSGLFTANSRPNFRTENTTGAAGDVTLATGKLIVRDGAQVSASTASSVEQGQGGNLAVNAKESIELSGTSADGQFPSGLFTNTKGVANAGRLTIETGRLMVRDGAQISASTNRGIPTEVNDAGHLPSTAQAINTQPAGTPLSSIWGSLSDVNDVDLFQIFLTGGGTFSASTVNGADFDTQLFLFDRNGLGVYSNNNYEGSQSTLPANDPLTPTSSGFYYLGISSYNNNPQSSLGPIFDSSSPTGPGGGAPLSSWDNNSFEGGPYAITLTGAEFATSAFAEAPFAPPKAGNGGSITINANTFEAANGGQVLTTTESSGRAGNITLTVPNIVTLKGHNSGLFANTALGSIGQGGDLTITTGQLQVLDGAQVSASTAGTGRGGTLAVSAPQGAVQLIGSGSGLFAQSAATGAAGNLTITTGQLQVLDGAEVTVSGQSGFAGNLTATARAILLDQGKLTAVTGAGSGGNIRLQMQDLLLMRDHSLISASALSTANGGNINIDTDFIVAVPSEDSDIIANAFEGNGGNIDITTQGIFGTQFREQRTPLSDITASSDFGVQGVVEINTPDIDPSRGLVNLPAELVDASNQIATGCTPGVRQGKSKFVITGRGGLPPNPNVALSSDAIQVDWVTLNPGVEDSSSPTVSTNPTAPDPDPIVEAQGWVINNYGEVVLTATAPTLTPHIPWMTQASCHTPETSL